VVDVEVGPSNRPSTNFSRSSRRTEVSIRASLTPAGGDGPDDELGPGLATELVTAGVDDLDYWVEPAEVFHALRPGGHRLAHDHAVADQASVGAHDALEAELVTEQVGDHSIVSGLAGTSVGTSARGCY
jgi:hypothetical protein